MSSTVPSALLLIAPGCPHCPGVLQALGNLLKEGVIGQLDAYNLAHHPEQAELLGARAVPYVRLGPFHLTGALSTEQLRAYAQRAADPEALIDHLTQRLAEGGLGEVEQRTQREPTLLAPLLELLARTDTPLQARLGASAILEQYAGSAHLSALAARLATLAQAPSAQLRSDAAYLLGLSGATQALPVLRALLDDESVEVREIAAEALEEWQDPTAS